MAYNRNALIVGIQDYNYLPKLQYSRNDAELMEQVLSEGYCLFSTKTLLDNQATSRAIRDQFKELLNKTEENGTFIFYFAGHGVPEGSTTFFVTLDQEDDIESTVSFSRLIELTNSYKKPGQNIIFILDCCHAGALSTEQINLSVGYLSNIQSQSITLIAGSESSGKAFEDDVAFQGIFTNHIFNGLSGSAANEDGDVTPSSLAEYVSRFLHFENKQKCIFKTTSIGSSCILSSGHIPNKKGNEILSPIEMETIENNIRTGIKNIEDNLQKNINDWKEVFYRRSCIDLTQIIEYKERKEKSYPELIDKLNIYNNKINSLIGQISDSLDIGTKTTDGIIIELIGQGGFGKVYVINIDGLKRAYKVYHGIQIGDKQKVQAFIRGYRAMQKLEHTNIVNVYNDTRSPIGFFMNYIEGPNFRHWWTEDASSIINVLHMIAQTLEHAHMRGVIHRDIKPENIIIDTSGKPYLTDFDLAWYSMATVYSAQGDAAAFGHYLYAAPEQYETPSSPITKKPTTDIYGFGQLCYFAICGSDPASDGSMSIAALRDRIQRWNVADAASLFVDMYEKCIQRKPSSRFQSMNEISTILLRIRQMLLDPDSNETLDKERFLRELNFSFNGSLDNSSYHLKSLSERTEIRLEEINSHKADIVFSVIREYTGFSGTFDQQRDAITNKLQSAIGQIKQINRGIQIDKFVDKSFRPYRVKIVVKYDILCFAGVLLCKDIITKVIDSIEAI